MSQNTSGPYPPANSRLSSNHPGTGMPSQQITKYSSESLAHLLFGNSWLIFTELQNICRTSRCARRKVAAILVRDGLPIAGYQNGPMWAALNTCVRCQRTRTLQASHPCAFEHAEARCCAHANPGDMLLTTTSPCLDCARLIIRSGISTVVYLDTYSDVVPLDLLASSGVVLCHARIAIKDTSNNNCYDFGNCLGLIV